MTKKFVIQAAATLLGGMCLVTASNAEEVFQNTSLTLGYTNQSKADPVFGSGTSDQNAVGLRFEHFGINGLGDNYFFADTTQGSQVGGPAAGSFGADTKRQYAIVWNARLSLSKMTGNKIQAGPIDDVSLMYRMERGSYANYAANMIGPSINLKLPGFSWFQTSLLINRQDFLGATSDDKKAHAFWHTYAIVPFELGGYKFTFAPLVWVNFSKGGAGTETYIEPDLWMKLGGTGVDVGFRYQYHRYANYTRTTPTLMARFNF